MTPASSPAAPRSSAAAVAVLPALATADGLELYTRAVPSAVAGALRARIAGAVTTPDSAQGVGSDVALVIDGRIVARGPDRVSLEAQVRDPGTGRVVGTVSTRVAELTAIDELAGELAGEIAPVIERWRRKKSEPPEPVRLPETVVELPAGAPANLAEAYPDGPGLLIVRPEGAVAGGAVPVADAAGHGASWLAARLGRREIPSALSGFPAPDSLVAELSARGASHALLFGVESVDFRWTSILMARGRVRIAVVNRAGQALYDRTVSTDTLVGSRGDRHTALVRLISEQAADIAAPAIREVLAR